MEKRGEVKSFTINWSFTDAFCKFLEKSFSPSDKIVLVGDMNVALEDIDVYDPVVLKDTIGTMLEERQALRRLLDWGFVDAFRYLYPNKVEFTWWDYIGGASMEKPGHAY
jgi:exodeoxyribonuclease-3